MNRVITPLHHKFTQALLVWLGALVVYRFVIQPPIPSSLLAIYMGITTAVVLLWVSASDAWWNEFKAPLITLFVERERKWIMGLRWAILVIIPALVGWLAYQRVVPRVEAPAELRSIHPAPPTTITFAGRTIDLQTAKNPFRDASGNPDPAALASGKVVYGTHCIFCHGDALKGNGLFANALNPRPADFTDTGTVAQLQEGYVFWRIAKGGPGLPTEGKGWNSAMPAWEGTLSEEEIWQAILYLYDATHQHPREAGLE
ncbi:MAG TPA: cytochrome c [Anaerolineales bacterium]|nr:cytochrome c [Anaerolineales bacterium]